MERYVRYRDVEHELLRLWDECHENGRFPDALRSLVDAGQTVDGPASLKHRLGLSEKVFLQYVGESLIPINQFVSPYEDEDSTIIPVGQDVFSIKVMRHAVRNIHPHGCFDVDYVYRGSAVLDYNGVRTELSEGDLCLVAPGSRYIFECDDDDDDAVLFTIYARRRVMERVFFDSMASLGIIADFIKTELYDQTSPNYLLFRANETAGLNEIVQNVFLESNYPDELSNEAATRWLHLLFVTVLRDFEFERSWRSPDGSVASFYSVLEYIHSHIAVVTLRSVAAHFGYNETYFSSLFREMCHRSFRDYVSDVRMVRAKELLLTTDLTVERVAASVGYSSADHLHRKFKHAFGLTPGQFRAQSRS